MWKMSWLAEELLASYKEVQLGDNDSVVYI